MGSEKELCQPLLADPAGSGVAEHVVPHAERPPPPADKRPAVPAAAAAASAATAQAAQLLGPLGSPNPLSAAAFSWVSPLLRRGSTQEQLHQRDLFDLPPHLLPAACGRRLLGKWRQVSCCWVVKLLKSIVCMLGNA